MSIDRAEVKRIAALAKLRFDDEEADRLAREMTRILKHAERLRGLATEDDGEAAEGGPAGRAEHVGRLGPDPLERGLGDFAPSMRDGFFLVPPPPGVVDPEG